MHLMEYAGSEETLPTVLDHAILLIPGCTRTDGRDAGDALVIGKGKSELLDVVIHHLGRFEFQLGEALPWHLLKSCFSIRRRRLSVSLL